MRVCFVAEHPSSGEVGGGEVATSVLANRLARGGVTVHYVSINSPKAQPKSLEFHQIPDWMRIVTKLVNRLKKNKIVESTHLRDKLASFLSPLRVRAYDRTLSGVDADVYVQVNAGALTGCVAHFCRRKKKPFIFRANSLWDADLSFEWGWTTWTNVTKKLYIQGVREADLVVANSVEAATLFMKYLDGNRVRFLPDCFEMPPCPNLSRTDGYVLWVGREAPYKQPWLFAELARMLPMYQFVMVGDIHSIERPPLNLQLLGRRNPNELPRIYSRAKVLVSTSKVEGFPSVLVEAATQGVPYVGFLDPDHVVRDYGIGEKASDLSEMAKILNKLMNEEDIRIKLGTNARRFVEEHRDIERTVSGWIRLFEELTYGRT